MLLILFKLKHLAHQLWEKKNILVALGMVIMFFGKSDANQSGLDKDKPFVVKHSHNVY